MDFSDIDPDVRLRRQPDSVVQLAEYNILGEMGTGAQGTVYKAQHEFTGEIHAIKELSNLQDGITAEAKMEIAVMKRLRHPNVTHFIAAYESPDSPDCLFLVLEYVEGGSLYSDSEVWAGGCEPLPFERCRDIAQQMVRGISYLHYKGVLHRDVKPSNVLGNRHTGTVKLSDFGVSSFTKKQKSARLLGEDDIVFVGSCGTPAFLPPEASGAGFDLMYHARPADVWALGVTFFFFLQGNLPFRGLNRMDTADLICHSSVKFTGKAPAQAKELIAKMLEKDPAKRCTLFSVQSHDWIDLEGWRVEEVVELSNEQDITAAEFMQSVSSTRRIVRRRRAHMIMQGVRSVVSSISRRASRSRSLSRSISGGNTESSSSELLNGLKQESTLSLTSMSDNGNDSEDGAGETGARLPQEDDSVVEKGLGKKLFLQCVTSL